MTFLRSVQILAVSAIVLFVPYAAFAQQEGADVATPSDVRITLPPLQQSNVPPQAQQAEAELERAARRFRVGVVAGVGLDPELIMFGGHGAFGPIFNRNIEFRPGVEFGIGEVTTMFGINLDVLYTLPGASRGTRWTPYVGAGPNFALSHRGFEEDLDDDDDGNRFDFSDTDFVGGFNFFAGARTPNGMFLEMKSTAYGVSNIRFLVGYNF